MALANVPVLSNHYDSFLSGANTQETTLTPANVNAANFGALFDYAVDGYTYAQPLYVPDLAIAGGTHNVVFAATQHDSVYAFNADAKTGGPNNDGELWHRSFIDPANGITSVPQPDIISGDIVPEVGITGTPIIDSATNTMYVVAKTKEVVGGVAHYVQRLHAVDIRTGQDRAIGGVVTIGDTTLGGPDGGYTNATPIFVAGTGAGSDGTTVRFNSLRALQRPALQMFGGVVYVAWASHGDNGPYHGWLVGFDATSLQPVKVFNTTPGTSASGIWQSGGAPAVDAQGNLYFAIGNGFNFAGREPFDSGNNRFSSLGGGGGGLGYEGIDSSVAVTLRAFTSSQVGLGINGAFQGQVPITGIDFNAAAHAPTPHTFRVDLTYNGATLGGSITDTTTTTVFALPSQAINLPQIVGGNTAYVGFTGATGGLNAQQDIQTWTYTVGGSNVIDHSAGFASNGDLKANGNASFTGTVARLTPAQNGQTGSVFSQNQVNVANFSTSFTFQMVAGTNPIADGITFTIQNNQPEFSEAVLKLSTTGQLSAVDYFVPFDWRTLDQADADLGSGGTMLLPSAVADIDPATGQPRQLMVETGKSGKIYLMDRNDLGGNNANFDRVRQVVQLGPAGVWGNPAFYQDGPNTGLIYYQGSGDVMKAFRITNGVLGTTPATQSNTFFNFPGSQPSISANGTSNAIAWGLEVDEFGQNGPAVLHAYNATNLQQELYTSAQTGLRDQMGGSVKFTFPIVTNGKVFAGANGRLSVFGLFPPATTAPAAPSNLAGTALSGTQVQLTWTNNATDATGVKILRSTDGVNFTPVNTVPRDTTTFTDSGLTASTLYHYRVIATNQIGDSSPSNTASVRTNIASPVLIVADVCVGSIDLSWTAVANDHYVVERSTDGLSFTPIATLPASQTAFMDTGLANGTYFYQVTAFSTFPEGTITSDSNVAKATIGPINIDHFLSPGNPGFTDHSDMLANGSAQFTVENLLRLNNNFGQAGSASEVQQVGIRGFTTSFQVRLHEGTQPNPADGFTFFIQPNSPTALGGGGGALGYQGIPISVAIKFDVFNNEGETDNSTGIFFNGSFPGLPNSAGEVNIALNPNNVNLRSQSTKTISLTYDGTTLTETIHDPTPGQLNNGDFTTTFTVDIPGVIGSDTAFVGFTGGTGGLFSLQDVLNWTYNEQEGNLPPRAPGDLEVASDIRHDDNRDDVTLEWSCNNAYTAQGFTVERSADGVNFTTIATLAPTVTSYTDQSVGPGAFTYRVRSFNAQGPSRPSNTVTAEINVPVAPLNLRILNVFAEHIQIGWDPNSSNQSGFQIERSTDGVHFAPIATVDAFTTSYTDERFPTPVYYRVEALSAEGDPGLPSNVLKVNSVGQFVGQDIGAVGFPGSATFDGLGTYSVNGSGSDIWDVADSFHFLYRPLSGDGTIEARVVSVQNTDFWAKAGVMIRESTAPGARNAFTLETPNIDGNVHNEPVFQWRPETGGGTNDSGNHVTPQPPAPIWLRLVRQGNSFSGFWALDVSNGMSHGPWNQLGSTVIVNMGTNALAGLAVTAHNNGTINNSVFDHVTVTQVSATALGAPTTLTVAHVVKYKTNSAITLSWHPGSDNEAGFHIERSSDGVNFTEVGTAGAGATTFIDTNPDGQGVPAGTYYYRVEAFAPGLPDSAFSNVDSVRFAAPGLPLTIDHSEGFASHGDLTTSGSTTIFPNPAPVGTFLGHQDLGGVAAPGTATFDSGLYTLRASGSDIWDVADSFQYVYKPLAGDGTIEARVVGVQNTDFWAKAGLMIRENLRANSKNAFMFATPPGHDEPVFQFRADTGGFSADYGNHISGLQAAPVWLRLVRQGNSFSGFWAQDLGGGMHGPWNQIGQDTTINMAGTVYVGLALTAHNNSGVLNTSTFDHVTITGATAPLPPTVVELTDGGFGEAGGAFLSNRVGIEDFTSTFTFQITPGTSPMADGLAFVIQGLGPTALGPTGGGLGYGSDFVGGGGGLGRSLAIKFDIFNNSGEGINSTGIFTNGRSPTVRQPGLAGGFPDTSINLDGTGINLASTHPFRVTLSYDGRALTETITDTVTSATFTTNYVVNIAALVGSDVGYVGFTGGTGGLSAVQQIQSWIFETTIAKHEVQPQLAAGGPAAPGDVSALTEAELALVAQEAVARWAASGLSPAQVAQLQSVQYHIGALGGGVLGLTELGSSVVTLDATAGGYGWFVGPGLPGDAAFDDVVAPEEFHAGSDSPAFGRMDLLTVVAHELGHVLGLSDLDPQVAPHDLLTETLAPGVRRLPGSSIEVLSPTIVLASDALLFLSTMPQAIAASDQQQPSIVTLNSPLAVNPYVEDEFARALVWAAQTSELEWLRAVPSDYNDADDARAELFAQLGDQKEFLDLFGDELES